MPGSSLKLHRFFRTSIVRAIFPINSLVATGIAAKQVENESRRVEVTELTRTREIGTDEFSNASFVVALPDVSVSGGRARARSTDSTARTWRLKHGAYQVQYCSR